MKSIYILFIFLFLQNTISLHFYLTEGEEKCFEDDIPEGNVNNLKKKKPI